MGLATKLKTKAHAEATNLHAHLLGSTWDLGQLFAVGHFVGCFLVFLFPLMSVWDVAFDTDVAYWFGNYPFWWTLPIPLMWLVILIYHMRRHYPKRKAVMISLIIPCVTFFLLGMSLKVKSDNLMDHIVFDNCGLHSREIRKLDEAAIDAEQFYLQCNPRGFGGITLESCPGFTERRKKWSQEWDYLQYLEGDCGCSNFCHSGRIGVWTAGAAKHNDACSECVLSVMRTKVRHQGYLLILYSALVLVVALCWLRAMKTSLMAIGEEMRANDHEIPHSWRATDRTAEVSRVLHSDRNRHAPQDPQAVFVPAPEPLTVRTEPLSVRTVSLTPTSVRTETVPEPIWGEGPRPNIETQPSFRPGMSRVSPRSATRMMSAPAGQDPGFAYMSGPPNMMSAPAGIPRPVSPDQEWADVDLTHTALSDATVLPAPAGVSTPAGFPPPTGRL